jgi:hypothetical protein
MGPEVDFSLFFIGYDRQNHSDMGIHSLQHTASDDLPAVGPLIDLVSKKDP